MNGVVPNLARFEGRMLLRHPAVVVGTVSVVLMVAANVGSPWEVDAYSALGGLGVATLGPFALLASNSAWARTGRDGAAELLSTLPTPAPSRIAGLLWSGTSAVALAAMATAAIAVAFRLGDVEMTRWPTAAELAQGPLAVGCAGILGVVLARWLPWRGAAAAAAVAVVVWQLPGSWSGPLVTGVVADDEGRIVGTSAGSVEWHLVWLLGWAGLGVAAVRLHDRRHLLAAGAAGLLVVVVAGTAQLP